MVGNWGPNTLAHKPKTKTPFRFYQKGESGQTFGLRLSASSALKPGKLRVRRSWLRYG